MDLWVQYQDVCEPECGSVVVTDLMSVFVRGSSPTTVRGWSLAGSGKSFAWEHIRGHTHERVVVVRPLPNPGPAHRSEEWVRADERNHISASLREHGHDPIFILPQGNVHATHPHAAKYVCAVCCSDEGQLSHLCSATHHHTGKDAYCPAIYVIGSVAALYT